MTNALTRLKAGRIWLVKNKPFFGFVAMHLNFIEKPEIPTCAVDKNGNFYYNPKFVDGLSKDEVRGVVLHELLHVILDHFNRKGNRDAMIFNYATDSVINYKINKEGLSIPKCAINPDRNGILKIFGKDYTVKNKSAEKFYNEIYDDFKKQMQQGNSSSGNGSGDSSSSGDGMKGFDEHIYKPKEENGSSGNNKEDGKKIKKGMTSKDWKDIMAKAKTMVSKSKGDSAGHGEEIIDEIMQPKISWQSKLRQLVKDYIPFDYTFQRPSRKSYYIDAYLPSTEKEKVEVIVNIDSSGSMSKEDLTRAVSEVIGIRNSYQNLKIILLYSDTKVYDPIEMENPSPEEIASHRPKGRGGTDHRPVFKFIEENYPHARLVVCMTDGQTDFPDKVPNINTIWCLIGSWRASKDEIPFGEVIVVDD